MARPCPPPRAGFFHCWTRIQGLPLSPGLIQIYTGEGKGKTTAAVGLAVRALGQGLRVLLARFLKPLEPASGEILFLQGTPGLEILTAGVGVIHGHAPAEEVAHSIAETFAGARRRMMSGAYDLVILDEINNAVHRGDLALAELLSLLDARPSGVEVVLTGRHAPAELLARADLVTVMHAGKHPFRAGIPARRGIEY
ncbi:MAG TPA: hypothetical protein DCF93_02325 [Desulfuromonas sp.]|nr:hypothetical protein [Desulfuromonas sp.]